LKHRVAKITIVPLTLHAATIGSQRDGVQPSTRPLYFNRISIDNRPLATLPVPTVIFWGVKNATRTKFHGPPIVPHPDGVFEITQNVRACTRFLTRKSIVFARDITGSNIVSALAVPRVARLNRLRAGLVTVLFAVAVGVTISRLMPCLAFGRVRGQRMEQKEEEELEHLRSGATELE
tara:strand:+ start:1747 stop:2280 length:534 start_codon:yes stop_codon:yes gene_type:complete